MEEKPIPYQIIRSGRKTVSIQVTPAGEVLVRCPRRTPLREIERIVAENSDRIETYLAKTAASPTVEKLTLEELHRLADQALAVIPERVAHFARQMGVTYGGITIRNQHTLWGSCSSKGNLNFNCLLMLVPPEVVDYVIVHELCHRREMNHSARFWTQVEAVLPDYQAWRKWLKDNGGGVIARLP